MKSVVITWTLIAIATLVVGPVAGWLCEPIRGFDGGLDATALLSTSPAGSLVRTLLVILIAVVYGCAAGKARGFKVGMFCCGLIVAWAAWHSARVDSIIRAQDVPKAMWVMSAESVVLALAALLGGYLIVHSADRKASKMSKEPVFVQHSGMALVIGLLVGGASAWAVARSEMVGQTFAAAVTAGIMGTLLGRVVAVRASVVASLAGVFLLAVAGPASAVIMNSGTIVADMYAGNLFALARPAPLDWIAGGFVGVAIGISWAGSMIERHVPEEQKKELRS